MENNAENSSLMSKYICGMGGGGGGQRWWSNRAGSWIWQTHTFTPKYSVYVYKGFRMAENLVCSSICQMHLIW